MLHRLSIVTQANNLGRGIDSPFSGLRSFEDIDDENGKHNTNRKIITTNRGGWKAVHCNRIDTPIVVETIFPGGPASSTKLTLFVAEIGVSKKALNPHSIWRGGIYNAAKVHGDAQASFLVTGLVSDYKDSRFFGSSRVVGTFVVKESGSTLRNGTFQSGLVLMPKTIICERRPLEDIEAAELLGIHLSKLHDL